MIPGLGRSEVVMKFTHIYIYIPMIFSISLSLGIASSTWYRGRNIHLFFSPRIPTFQRVSEDLWIVFFFLRKHIYIYIYIIYQISYIIYIYIGFMYPYDDFLWDFPMKPLSLKRWISGSHSPRPGFPSFSQGTATSGRGTRAIPRPRSAWGLPTVQGPDVCFFGQRIHPMSGEFIDVFRKKSMAMQRLNHGWTDGLEVPIPFFEGRKMLGLNFREYPQKIWPNIWYVYVPPLNRILKFPLKHEGNRIWEQWEVTMVDVVANVDSFNTLEPCLQIGGLRGGPEWIYPGIPCCSLHFIATPFSLFDLVGCTEHFQTSLFSVFSESSSSSSSESESE